jgi:uncharacterized protein (DUF697 family)/GTP-binding protein EngB required for normal cell division
MSEATHITFERHRQKHEQVAAPASSQYNHNMRQTLHFAADLHSLLLCCSDADLAALAVPLRKLSPGFADDPVILHSGHRLSRCAHLVAAHIASVIARLPAHPYREPQADLAAAALTRAGAALKTETTLAELEADLLRAFAGRQPSQDHDSLALSLARLRVPMVRRARWVGVEMAGATLILNPEKVMTNAVTDGSIDKIWPWLAGNFAQVPILKEFFAKVVEEQQKLGKVNILIAGKTGVGKSTLVNVVFGANVASTGSGRPVTAEISWYEPAGLPVRLCDTKGLELADFDAILGSLEAEITRSLASGKVEDRIHLLWLCIAEPGARVEQGEIQLVQLCARYQIPALVVLTKAIGPKTFAATVKELLPEARAIIRVLAEEWDDDPPRPRFGLPELIRATHDLLPEATRNAFDAVQRIILDRKRARALAAVRAAAGAAGLAAATPIPLADAAAVFSVNASMVVAVSVVMGVQMSASNIQTLAGSMLGAMAVTGGARLIAGEVLKLIPGFGSIAGGFITSGIAASATYGLGYGYIEFLCRFQAAEHRMPDGEEIRLGFRKFWESWEAKEQPPPPA